MKKNIDLIENVCNSLDWLAAPDIEKQMVCTLDCCAANTTWVYIDKLINDKETLLILGDTGLDLLRELARVGLDALCSDDEEGFSKKQPWLDFVDLVNKVNSFLKDSVKKYKRNNT